MSGRTGRRPGESTTRTAILDAARRQFAQRGYDGATFRGIAAEAGVDPALIRHFFGAKESLFAHAMRLPFSPAQLIAQSVPGDRDQLGERIAGAVLAAWEVPEARVAALAMLRAAATQEQAARMLQEFAHHAVVAPIAAALGGPDAEERAALAVSQIAGVIVTRYVLRVQPLASMPVAEVRAAIAPTLQRYLAGS